MVSIYCLRFDRRLDNLTLIDVSNIVDRALDWAISGSLAIPEIVGITLLKNVFEVDEALFSDKNIIVLNKIGNVDLLSVLDADVLEVASRQLKVVIARLHGR